jgi:hypothetical protein
MNPAAVIDYENKSSLWPIYRIKTPSHVAILGIPKQDFYYGFI